MNTQAYYYDMLGIATVSFLKNETYKRARGLSNQEIHNLMQNLAEQIALLREKINEFSCDIESRMKLARKLVVRDALFASLKH